MKSWPLPSLSRSSHCFVSVEEPRGGSKRPARRETALNWRKASWGVVFDWFLVIELASTGMNPGGGRVLMSVDGKLEFTIRLFALTSLTD